MIKKIGWFVFASMFFSSTALATSQDEGLATAEKSCQVWALEDGVTQGEMEDYMSKCIAQLQDNNGIDDEEFLKNSQEDLSYEPQDFNDEIPSEEQLVIE